MNIPDLPIANCQLPIDFGVDELPVEIGNRLLAIDNVELVVSLNLRWG